MSFVSLLFWVKTRESPSESSSTAFSVILPSSVSKTYALKCFVNKAFEPSVKVAAFTISEDIAPLPDNPFVKFLISDI